MARDYVVAANAKKASETLKNTVALNKKLTNMVEDVMAKHADESKVLYNLIKDVEKQCAPRQYVINRNTNNVHKVLTLLQDVGRDAIAYCGFKYACASVILKTELPAANRDHYCSTCLAEVRAAMAK